MEFRNYYMMKQKISLVEFHDIDIYFVMGYNINIGIPRKDCGKYGNYIFWSFDYNKC